MPEPAYSDDEIDAALAAIADPQRLRLAQELVQRTAPTLQRVLASALYEGGWFGSGHEQAVRDAAGEAEGADRVRAIETLLAEETRLGMLVGVAVGFELARELGEAGPAGNPPGDQHRSDAGRGSQTDPARDANSAQNTTQED